ncbi:HEXXH motif domain-containing protein [Amycolatopsis sp. NBC_01488]|uniref:HEXXH motif domain-containing protein n=1 Tax=Amycolatopsis sp. NBC_01488 TaxID=2903563 RepID=UPI002E2949EA|nr:HEXXH motif domain-containing protein [Amycolatopsis sp. NBC_01488]
MPVELPRHQLPRSSFTQLSAGPAGKLVINQLRASQLSRRKLQLRALIELLEATEKRAVSTYAWPILVAAERRNSEIVDELLLHPSVGVWLTRSLRKLSGAPLDSTPLRTDLDYLASLAGAAALRCGIPCTIDVPVVHGVVTLPTVGQLELPLAFPAGKAILETAADGSGSLRTLTGVSVEFDPPLPGPGFFPARRHTVESHGARLSVEIDDRGPYRVFSAPVPPDPLDPPEYSEWTKLLGEAWQILTSHYAGFADELAHGMSTLVPLESENFFTGASSSNAFGAIAMTAKYSAVDLAETLVHELQHSKMNALLELVDLVDPDFGKLLYAPWRDDPRPASGLLHGIFAFLTAVEFWRVQLRQDETAGRHAWFSYAYRRHQVRQTIDVLLASDALTELGRQFVASLSDRLDSVDPAAVPSELDETVTRVANEEQATWRLRHLRPDESWVIEATDAWAARTEPPRPPVGPGEVTPWHRSVPRSPRMDLLRLHFLGQTARRRNLSAADLAYVNGDLSTARSTYAATIRTTPQDDQAWLGLGLTMAAAGQRTALLTAPHLVLGIRDRLLSREDPGDLPVELVEWLITAAPAG